MSDEKGVLIEKVREFEKRTGRSVDSYPDDPNNTASVLKEKRYLSERIPSDEASKQMSSRSRRNFLIGGAAAMIGIFGWRWMSDRTKQDLFRRTFEFNERVSQLFGHGRLAPEFPPESITKPERYNGGAGLMSPLDTDGWRLNVAGLPGREAEISLTIDEIRALPRTEMTTEFKCIEGWSTIVHWSGVRFSDLVAACGVSDPLMLPKYVSINTPDQEYFVGWDVESIMHPQTLLAYEMNGEQLKMVHGAPLRLASPLKYGIKQIKRIGKIEFTNERPRDYWAQPEYGYDWFAGH